MVELIEKTELSDNAVNFLKEVNSVGGKIDFGESKHRYLRGDLWKEAWSECGKQKLVYKSDGGGDCYMEYSITERGYKVLELVGVEKNKK